MGFGLNILTFRKCLLSIHCVYTGAIPGSGNIKRSRNIPDPQGDHNLEWRSDKTSKSENSSAAKQSGNFLSDRES